MKMFSIKLLINFLVLVASVAPSLAEISYSGYSVIRANPANDAQLDDLKHLEQSEVSIEQAIERVEG